MEFGFKASDVQPGENVREEVVKRAETMLGKPLAETAFILVEVSPVEYKLVPKSQIAELN